MLTVCCFNPRPRTGGDVIAASMTGTKLMFQSTPPHGGRLGHAPPRVIVTVVSIHAPARGATNHIRGNDACASVSIHAPARGATYPAARSRLRYRCFNPRPRTGGDHNPFPILASGSMFQSTPPHGGRRAFTPAMMPPTMFQSTPPHGGRRRPWALN